MVGVGEGVAVGLGVSVGGIGVSVGGCAVSVAGTGVSVGAPAVAVGGSVGGVDAECDTDGGTDAEGHDE